MLVNLLWSFVVCSMTQNLFQLLKVIYYEFLLHFCNALNIERLSNDMAYDSRNQSQSCSNYKTISNTY